MTQMRMDQTADVPSAAPAIIDGMKDHLRRTAEILGRLDLEAIGRLVEKLHEAWRTGRRVFIFGNGGSAASALGIPWASFTIGLADVRREIEKLVSVSGEPLADPAWLPSSILSRRAVEDVRLVMVGEGASTSWRRRSWWSAWSSCSARPCSGSGGRRTGKSAAEPAPTVGWHPFQLNPDIPLGGADRGSYLEHKFGGPERAREIYERVETVGHEVGIWFEFERIERQPNTLNAHRPIAWAQAARPAIAGDLVERLFRAYFTQGVDIGVHRATGPLGR